MFLSVKVSLDMSLLTYELAVRVHVTQKGEADGLDEERRWTA